MKYSCFCHGTTSTKEDDCADRQCRVAGSSVVDALSLLTLAQLHMLRFLLKKKLKKVQVEFLKLKLNISS